jgi:FkbM family methyltransferase
LPLRCNIEEETGYSLHTTGICDLVLSEMIARMTRRGEVAIDVGANIGYVTSLMAVAVGTQGTVFSFEPHPRTFSDLERNVLAWADARDVGTVRVFKLALSNSAGTAFLTEPEGFEHNCGLASIAHYGEGEGIGMKGNTVNTARLDEIVKTPSAAGIMKVDVEGHELRVFEGAGDLISSRKIRDVVFEEFAPYPAPTHRMLEGFGYTIFHVEPRLLGPALQRTSEKWQPPAGSPPNYLATSDPGRALRKFEPSGWRCLAGRGSRISPRTLN